MTPEDDLLKHNCLCFTAAGPPPTLVGVVRPTIEPTDTHTVSGKPYFVIWRARSDMSPLSVSRYSNRELISHLPFLGRAHALATPPMTTPPQNEGASAFFVMEFTTSTTPEPAIDSNYTRNITIARYNELQSIARSSSKSGPIITRVALGRTHTARRRQTSNRFVVVFFCAAFK